MSAENTHKGPVSQLVKVLYDYEYNDEIDNRTIWMNEGEVFNLLNTESSDWWEVSRADQPECPFYVPSTYVQLLDTGHTNSVSNDHPGQKTEQNGGQLNTFGSKDVLTSFTNKLVVDDRMDSDQESSNYMNVNIETFKMDHGSNKDNFTVQCIPKASRPTDFGDGGDYANLDEFRQVANIPNPKQSSLSTPPQSPQENDYANLESLNIQPSEPSPPVVKNCEFKKTLMDTWDQYLDPDTNRLFYIHNETQEIQWKPPRGQYHNEMKSKRSGGSSPTKSPTSDPGEIFAEPQLAKKPTETGDQRSRATKPVEDEGSPRNLTPDIQQSQTFSQSVNLNEPIEGTLNKCKLPNSKNAAKKSAKRWAYAYVKLSGSHLLFYKDQKSTTPTKNQPHGKYEQIVSLVTCSVEKDPKMFTSKKNTICITSPEHHILLQAEDNAKITEWFIKLHTKIQELGGKPDPPVLEESATAQLSVPQENEISRKPSFKEKGHSRKPSDGGTMERKGKVRDYLAKFMTTRSDKERLVKKGIYKDAVFGSEIKSLCDKEKSKVPSFVVRSIEAIEKRGLDHEGLYRIGGNVSQIQKLRCMVDQGEKYDLDDPQWDINILAGCLKLFFRELKEPLFTFPLFDKFLKSFLKESASERLKAIKATMNELPKNNYETVKVLFTHLINVMDNHLENKMHAHQLAIVFGPTLIWPEVQSGNLATSMVYQSRIVEFVLIEYKNIFR